MQRVVGIDFGTSTTYMSVKRYNGSQPVEDAFSYMPVMFNYGESSGYVASIIRENGDGTFDFGEKAAEEMDGARIYTEIKMCLEHPSDTIRNEARRLVKAFFKFLYDTYSQQITSLGSADDMEETVISYPVKWQKETVDFMLQAAVEAGFKNVRGMDEATAAVSTVLCHNAGKKLIRTDRPGYLLLVDMGAGTTDLVLCKYQVDKQGGLKVELVNNWPRDAQEPSFGGREVDRVLEGYVEAYLAKALNPVLAPNAHGIAAAPGAAKRWKELNVSVNLGASKPVTNCAYISTYKSMGMLTGNFPAFDRSAFETFAQQGLKDYVKLVSDCLTDTAGKDADFEAAGVDLVILTGGHSAWYFAREIVDGTMAGYLEHPALAQVREHKDHVVNLPNPQSTVSLGLVYSKLPLRLNKPPAKPPVKPPVKPSVEPGFEGDVVDLVRKIIAEAPDFSYLNQVAKHSDCSNLARFGEIDVFYFDTRLVNCDCGLVMVPDGILYKEAENSGVVFFEWERFANSSYTDHPLVFSYEGEQIRSFDDKDRYGLLKLYHALRAYYGCQNGEQPVQDEKPPVPEKKYRWDPRLLPIIKKFVQENEILREKMDCLHNYQPDELLRKVNLAQLVGDEVYHASDEFTLSLFGWNKRIITSTGFGVRWHNFGLGYDGTFITWKAFIGADLNDPESVVVPMIRCLDRRLLEPFAQLQAQLRQAAKELD